MSLHDQIDFLNQLASLLQAYDAEIFTNDEGEIRMDLHTSIEGTMPDERGDAIFFERGGVTQGKIRRRL